MPSFTRRRALAAAGGLGVLSAGALGVESTAGPAPTFEEWVPAEGDWPARRRGPRRTAAAPDATPPTTEPDVVWEAEVPNGSALVVADGTVYVGDDGGVAAVDLEDGTELWTSDTAGETLCHAGDTLYCGVSRDGATLTALEDDIGERRFAAEDAFHRVWDLLALDETLLVGDHGSLKGCDPETGDVEWERNVGGSGRVYPSIADGRLYAGGPGPLEIYGPHEGWDAVRRDGPKRLERGDGPTFGSAPVVDDGDVYIGVDNAHQETAAFGFDRDGRPAWEGPSAHRVSSPALADGTGVLTAWSHDDSAYRLLGVDLEGGATIWSETLETTPTDPVVAGELAIVSKHDGRELLAVDAETGESVWTTALDRVTVHTPRANTVVPTGDRILVAGEDGVLRCLR